MPEVHIIQIPEIKTVSKYLLAIPAVDFPLLFHDQAWLSGQAKNKLSQDSYTL